MDRDDLKVIAFAHPWKKPLYQVVKSEQFQGKWQVAEVTQYWHFENPPKIDEGNLAVSYTHLTLPTKRIV